MRALALAGGGVRGVVSLRALLALQDALGAPITSRVDVVAGTSAGALIACALAVGYTLGETLDRFRDFAGAIFDPGAFGHAELLTGPRYDAEPLELALEALFGGRRMGDFGRAPRVLVPLVDRTNRRRAVAKSWAPEWARVPIAAVLRAAVAAPTYFDPARFAGAEWIDGGLGANDPSMFALDEALALGAELDGVRLVAVGTGAAPRPAARSARGASALRLLPEILDLAIDLPAADAAHHAQQLLGDRYARLDPVLMRDLALDAVRFVPELEAWSAAWCDSDEGAAAIEHAAALLA